MIQKDFDTWNTRKKYLQSEGRNPLYHVGEIWWCHLGVNIGFEEDGTGHDSERPVVIIRRFNQQLCWIIPLSTSLKKNLYYKLAGTVEGKLASAILSQMRPVDTKRFINLIEIMPIDIFNEIKQAAKALL
jgi:mRNA interferase MazF